jgi:hypothetical protein
MRKLITILFFLMIGFFMMASGQTNKHTQKPDTIKKKTVTVTKDENGKEKVEKEKEVNRKREHKKNINESEKK